jgi:ABC-2 type transport system permease protein
VQYKLNKLDLYRWINKLAGVDHTQFKTIVNVKKTILKKQKIVENIQRGITIPKFTFQLVLFFLAGVFASAGVIFESVTSGMTLSYSMLMMILGVTFIGHFSNEWLSNQDNSIIFPLPISGKTLFAAQCAMDIYYIFSITLFCSLATLVAVIIQFGILSAVIFLLTLFLMVFFLIMLTQLICLLSLRRNNQKSTQNSIFYFIIGIYIALIFLTNFFIDNFNHVISLDFRAANIEGYWMIFYPPSWMAAMIAISQGDKKQLTEVLTLMALIIPTGGLAISSIIFTRNFKKLKTRIEGQLQGKSKTKFFRLTKIYTKILGLKFGTQQAFFHLSQKLMFTDRQFQMRTYPNIGGVIALLMSYIYRNHQMPAAEFVHTPAFFSFIYLVTTFLSMSIIHLKYTERHKAAWLYYALPISTPGHATISAMKSFIITFVIPVNVIIILIFLSLWGWEPVIHILVASCASILIAFRQCKTVKLSFPFELDLAAEKSPEKLFTSQFAVFPPLIVIGLIHYSLDRFVGSLSLIPLGAALLIMSYFVNKSIAKTSWLSLKSEGTQHIGWSETPTNSDIK